MLQIFPLEVTPFAQNCRVLRCSESGAAAVVDPGGDVDLILEVLKEKEIHSAEIWLTHSHLDHCGGVADLKQQLGGALVGHREERIMREHVQEVAAMYGLPSALLKNCPEPERYISGGETLHLGGIEFKVLFTPGHSPGHLCFYNAANGYLIAGDTLFRGSIGRTDLPGGDYETLIRSIKEVILSLPDQTKVLSGHGPDTTVGAERKSNPFLVG